MSAAGLGYSAALVLAVLFALAAAAKLRDQEATVRSFDALGVPNPASAARLLPLPELAVVALLVVVPVAGALAVLVLLAFFTTFLVGRLRAGVDAPCACFGASSSRPLSWAAIGRNALMGALAVTALLATRPVVPTVADLAVVLAATAVGGGVLHLARPAQAAG